MKVEGLRGKGRRDSTQSARKEKDQDAIMRVKTRRGFTVQIGKSWPEYISRDLAGSTTFGNLPEKIE